MVQLTHAHKELFRRSEDERFESLPALVNHCQSTMELSREVWHPPSEIQPEIEEGRLRLSLGSDGASPLDHWSFSQFCNLCGVNRETINRLTPETACRALTETRPGGAKPMQALVDHQKIRSLHGTQYARLWNYDLLDTVSKAAHDFSPPQKAAGGGTGLYCGEQDMFAFLIDPAGWTEIGGEAFAPGFFVWNSEVGKRSVGVQTFWFQAICGNHIVWDAVEVVEFSRKHTGNVGDALEEIHRIVANLAAKRDARRDGFAQVIERAMQERCSDAEEAKKLLTKQGIPRKLIKDAITDLGIQGKPLTLWSLVDALTRQSQHTVYAADRTEADRAISQLLALAA